MAFLTFATAARFAAQLNDGLRKSACVTAATEADVFIAHSSLDRTSLRGVERLLAVHSASYYIDKRDSSLPSVPSVVTADLLASRIALSRRLIVVVTENSAQSRWVPWEMGVAHGAKGPKYVASLPMAQDPSEKLWARQEYLGLYPQITWKPSISKWAVTDPLDNRYWSLEDWIREEELS